MNLRITLALFTALVLSGCSDSDGGSSATPSAVAGSYSCQVTVEDTRIKPTKGEPVISQEQRTISLLTGASPDEILIPSSPSDDLECDLSYRVSDTKGTLQTPQACPVGDIGVVYTSGAFSLQGTHLSAYVRATISWPDGREDEQTLSSECEKTSP